jgi:hypothetical protein
MCPNPPFSILIYIYTDIGAMTLCPNPPFRILSMRKHPIVIDPNWYEGPWMNKVASYVVYPIGIDIDPEEPHNLAVSIGIYIYIIMFKIAYVHLFFFYTMFFYHCISL